MLTKTELARKAGLSVLTIDRVEKGMTCRINTQRKVLFALGLTLSEVRRVLSDELALLEAPARSPQAPLPAPEPGLERRGMFSGLRVLVVDDEDSVRDVLAERLQYWGCKVEMAVNGDQGVESYRLLRPDLVLLDLEMPEKNGFDSCQSILELNSDAAIILVTGSADTTLARKALEKGLAKLVLTKPFQADQLKMAIQDATRRPKPQEVAASKKGAVA